MKKKSEKQLVRFLLGHALKSKARNSAKAPHKQWHWVDFASRSGGAKAKQKQTGKVIGKIYLIKYIDTL